MQKKNRKEATVDKWKMVILSRYLGQFQPENTKGVGVTVQKTSADVVEDLSDMGEFSIDEVSEELVLRGYGIEVQEDGVPRWKMKKMEESNRIE